MGMIASEGFVTADKPIIPTSPCQTQDFIKDIQDTREMRDSRQLYSRFLYPTI